jgi:hypothetical protein
MVVIILLSSLTWTHISDSYESNAVESKSRISERTECFDELGDELLYDDFISAPFGFNSSLWNLYTVNDPTLTWADGESQVFNSERFMHTTLESVENTGPEVIAEFNLRFSGGLSYFGIGWADGFQDPINNWISNLRLCQNGVFIDYWDNELLLVSCSDGESIATIIPDVNLTQEHRYRLTWSESLIRLQIDDITQGMISRCVPSVGLKFAITSSGHNRFVEADRLIINRVGVYVRELCETEVYPKISLIWPSNTSELFDFDEVDIEIEGENVGGLYSWDGKTNSSFFSPWDIPVPDSLGLHSLDVYAEDSEENWSSFHAIFTVTDQETSISVPDSTAKPQIDGIVSNEESVFFDMFELTMRGEDRSEIPFTLFTGYYNDSLYVGVVTPLPDRYNSRIALYVDGEGSGSWGDAELGSMEDVCITSEAPSADKEYRGITTPYGQEVHPVGVVYDSGLVTSGVVAEFLIPVKSVNGNSTIGLGIYLVFSQGGFSSYFPVSDGNLMIVGSSGQHVLTSVDGISLIIILVGICILTSAVFVLKKKPRAQIDVKLEDEELERIRTLLISHPEITIKRLALLANTDTKSVRLGIEKLLSNDQIDSSVTYTETAVIRKLTPSEKKQK